MLAVLCFLSFTIAGCALSLTRGPFWGLIAYINIYFNTPDPRINWWGELLPSLPWNLVVVIVILISILIHRDKVTSTRLANLKWGIFFLILSELITLTIAVNEVDAGYHTYLLFCYVFICWVIVRSVHSIKQFDIFCLFLIFFAAYLSLKGHFVGERVQARLEGIGPSDSAGANLFAYVLVSILPLTLPFLAKGKLYEKVICLLSLPLIINGIILCNSRSALVSFLGASLVAVTLADSKTRRKIVLLLIPLVFSFVYLADDSFIERISTLTKTEQALNDTDTEAIDQLSSGRTEIWRYGIMMVSDYPFGAGPNGFKKLAKDYMPVELLSTRIDPEGVRAAHSTYLQVLVEQGYLGIGIWIAMCVHTLLLLFVWLRTLQRSTPQSKEALTVLAMIVSLCVIMIGGLLNSRVYYELFWWQVALVASLNGLLANSQSHPAVEQVNGHKKKLI